MHRQRLCRDDVAQCLAAQPSGGQQQRVVLARAVSCDTAFLHAGEPDSHNGEQVMNPLKELRNAASTICRVPHDPRYAQHADRENHLLDGKLVEQTIAAGA